MKLKISSSLAVQQKWQNMLSLVDMKFSASQISDIR